MKREELIAELKDELKEISDDIDILEKIRPNTVYRANIYGESIVKVVD